tara:strand:- start:246 stop:515 length:270 start_codon:yes stop_codon:yes gene_type:complete
MKDNKELFRYPKRILSVEGDGEKQEDFEKRIEDYNQLTINEKILIESQEQTRKINKIYNNIKFYFWLTMISIVLYILILFVADKTPYYL